MLICVCMVVLRQKVMAGQQGQGQGQAAAAGG